MNKLTPAHLHLHSDWINQGERRMPSEHVQFATHDDLITLTDTQLLSVVRNERHHIDCVKYALSGVNVYFYLVSNIWRKFRPAVVRSTAQWKAIMEKFTQFTHSAVLFNSCIPLRILTILYRGLKVHVFVLFFWFCFLNDLEDHRAPVKTI